MTDGYHKTIQYLFKCFFLNQILGPKTSHERLGRNNHNIRDRAVSAPIKMMRSASSRQRINMPELGLERNLIQTPILDGQRLALTRPTSTSTCVSSKAGSFKTHLSTWNRK